MRKLILTFSLVAMLLPALVSAYTCPSLYRTLQIGMSGSDVKQLQVFLIETGDLAAGNTTGYFGPLTRAAVRSFQCREMSICSGSEATNGYGKVGPMTRQAIQRVCSGTALPSQPSPTSPQNAPTCTMSVNPSSLAFGSSALLSWYSTNASSGFISPIGAVQPNGSQTVSPQQTTTYFGTFWNANNTSSQCQTTLTVAAPGQTCEHANPPTGCYWQSGATCAQDQLICPNTNQASCTLDGVTIQHGQIRKFYSQREAASASLCQTYSIDRTCTNGVLSGSTSYQYANCTVTGATCTPEQPQTQTLSCPAGQTGSITQTRTSTCPGPTWGAWTTTSNTCTTPVTDTRQVNDTSGTNPSVLKIKLPTANSTVSLGSKVRIEWESDMPVGLLCQFPYYPPYIPQTQIARSLKSSISYMDWIVPKNSQTGQCALWVFQDNMGQQAGFVLKDQVYINITSGNGTETSCTTPWATNIPSGQSVIAYKTFTSVNGVCESETRQCTDTVLSGTFEKEFCN